MKNRSITLFKTPILNCRPVYITGSKSESNRALILNALTGDIVSIKNLSDARDTCIMKDILSSSEKTLNVLDAGTTMRFLTAYFAVTNQYKILTGTERMMQRPIGILVDALREIGAKISYIEKEGYPPVELSGFTDQKTDRIKIRGDVSSQFISALLMVAAVLPKGLKIELTGTLGSRPYIHMTLKIMEKFGIRYNWKGNSIKVMPQTMDPAEVEIEPDWSGASYWYAFVALAKEADLFIPGLKKNSLQGDAVISTIAKPLGVLTEYTAEGINLRKTSNQPNVQIDFSDYPDLVQTVAVICAAKNIQGKFSGLKSLRIKETDRIKALQRELAKLNTRLIDEGDDNYRLIPATEIPVSAQFDTYEDHRMAMSFAPLSTIMNIEINDPEVVKKSYPSFWDEVKKVGIKIQIT